MVVKLNQEHVTVTGYHGHLFVLRQREKSQVQWCATSNQWMAKIVLYGG